jgi:hypothetical protein
MTEYHSLVNYKQSKFIWLLVLEAGKSKIEESYLMGAFMLHYPIEEGGRQRTSECWNRERMDIKFMLLPGVHVITNPLPVIMACVHSCEYNL